MYNPGQVFEILLCLHLLSASDFKMTKNRASLISMLTINLRNSKNASMDFGNVLALRSPSSFQSKEPYDLLSIQCIGNVQLYNVHVDIQGVSKKRYFYDFCLISVLEFGFYFFTCVSE